MSYHVDVIETDWAAGVERLAARLEPGEKGVDMTFAAGDTWAEKLLRPIPDGFGESVGPDGDGKLFLYALVERLEHGSYVRAFAPHEEYECPFGNRTERSLTLVQQTAAARQAPSK